jgi:hypothetical protein
MALAERRRPYLERSRRSEAVSEILEMAIAEAKTDGLICSETSLIASNWLQND